VHIIATVSSELAQTGINAAAFALDGALVVVVMSENDVETSLDVRVCGFGATLLLPAHAIQTYSFPNPC
jgi:hypothetical protein